MKIRKIYDPYKQQTFANLEDLLAFFKDVKEHSEQYNEAAVARLAEEILGKTPQPIIERPF